MEQSQADQLLQVEKHRLDASPCDYPSAGSKLSLPLVSADGREEFILDITRSSIAMKVTHQTRYEKIYVLARLDLSGAPHRNPDGELVPTPHLHLYREGYNHKWAYPLPSNLGTNPYDLFGTLSEFMTFCNITEPPIIHPRMF